MSIFKVGEKDFAGREFPLDTVCFLCGITLRTQKWAVYWMGQDSHDIFFHVDCVPGFCRRILSDWEQVKGTVL